MTHSWPSSSWPIGTRVRWRPEIAKTAWVGEVTGHPHPRMVETDGRGRVSIGLLERVGTMASMVTQVEMDAELAERIAALYAENAELVRVVEQQMDAIGNVQKERDNLQELVEDVPDLVSNLCLALGYGRNPLVPTGIPELDALVRHVLP